MHFEQKELSQCASKQQLFKKPLTATVTNHGILKTL